MPTGALGVGAARTPRVARKSSWNWIQTVWQASRSWPSTRPGAGGRQQRQRGEQGIVADGVSRVWA
ncbi:MAG: hypothetical protein WB800_29295 [Streptosporangiaceae bacterium]